MPQTRREPSVKVTISRKFVLETKSYDSQYSSLYFCRLVSLRSHVRRAAPPGLAICEYIKDLSHHATGECMLVGTVFKAMRLKPQALDKYMAKVAPDAVGLKFVDPSDALMLEDETGRIRLIGEIDPQLFVTGMVIGCVGENAGNGSFSVHQVIPAELPRLPAPICPALEHSKALEGSAGDAAILFINDLGIGEAASYEWRKALLSFLVREHAALSIGLVVIFCRLIDKFDVAKLQAFDGLVSAIAPSVVVHLVPNDHSVSIPQQPYPKNYVNCAGIYDSVYRVTNPHYFETEGDENSDKIKIMCLPHACAKDLTLYSAVDDLLESVKLSLKYRSIAPTAPETLSCYPYLDSDPFTLSEDKDFPDLVLIPDPDAATCRADTLPNDSVVSTLPAFAKSGEALILNVAKRELHTLRMTKV